MCVLNCATSSVSVYHTCIYIYHIYHIFCNIQESKSHYLVICITVQWVIKCYKWHSPFSESGFRKFQNYLSYSRYNRVFCGLGPQFLDLPRLQFGVQSFSLPRYFHVLSRQLQMSLRQVHSDDFHVLCVAKEFGKEPGPATSGRFTNFESLRYQQYIMIYNTADFTRSLRVERWHSPS